MLFPSAVCPQIQAAGAVCCMPGLVERKSALSSIQVLWGSSGCPCYWDSITPASILVFDVVVEQVLAEPMVVVR
jgi:hypothetical protein